METTRKSHVDWMLKVGDLFLGTRKLFIPSPIDTQSPIHPYKEGTNW